MIALVLPTTDPRVDGLVKAVYDKGHEVRVFPQEGSKFAFFEQLKQCNVLLALGNLTARGIFLWGYAAAKNRRVIAFDEVEPLFCTKTHDLDAWVAQLPVQLRLFQETSC